MVNPVSSGVKHAEIDWIQLLTCGLFPLLHRAPAPAQGICTGHLHEPMRLIPTTARDTSTQPTGPVVGY